jgi:anhydro-N-acetylmuramic acid kinase
MKHEFPKRQSFKTKRRVAGLMSGTSGDGVDVAIIDIEQRRIRVRGFETCRYSKLLREQLFRLYDPELARVDQLCHFNFVLGNVFADSLIKLCQKLKIALKSVDLVGSHGHTIYHQPKGRRFGKTVVTSTLQIGEPAIIARRTGIRTVADFRPADMAVGGQGAPLVPYADRFMFQSKKENRAIQNIGGIANVTWLPRDQSKGEIMAFDSGPGNMIVDRFAELITDGKKRYDRNGAMAGKGAVHGELMTEMLKHPFLRRRPPKSTGREEFGLDYSDALWRKAKKMKVSSEDRMATVTAYTARTIAHAYRRYLPALPGEVVVCGGGAYNSTLVGMIAEELDGISVIPSDDLGIPCDAREAIAFAVLACATVDGQCNNIPAATGATKPVIMGKIVQA